MGDRAQIFLAERLSAVGDDVGHAPERRGPSVAPGLEKLDDVGFAPGSEAGEGIAAKVVGDKVVGDVVLAVTVTVTVTFMPEEQCEPLPTAQTNVMVPPLAKAPELYVIGSKVYDDCPGVSSSVPMFEQDAVGEIFTVCPFAGYLKTT